MVPVISVTCRQFKMKNTLFSHALFLCPCMQTCSLRLQFADLFHDLPMAQKITVNQTGAFYFSQACSEDVFNFFLDFYFSQAYSEDVFNFSRFFISPKLVLRMSSIFSTTTNLITIVLFQSLWMFFYGWCSPATWTVKLPGWRSNLSS